MKTETFTATADSAYGKKLDSTLTYVGEFEAYETIAEVRSANDLLSDKEIVEAVNRRRKSAARNKALLAALDAAGIVKPTLENDGQLRLKEMVKILVASGKSETEARLIASTVVGIDWAD